MIPPARLKNLSLLLSTFYFGSVLTTNQPYEFVKPLKPLPKVHQDVFQRRSGHNLNLGLTIFGEYSIFHHLLFSIIQTLKSFSGTIYLT